MINEKTLKEWCAALLSGRYEEQHGELRCYMSRKKFDALGVLLDVIEPGGWHKVSMSWQHPLAEGSQRLCESVLPRDIQNEIINLIDIDLWGYAEIAEHLRATLPARIQRHELELERRELGAERAEACA